VLLLVGYQPTGAVGYISYNMGTFDLPEIYTLALGPASCPCYNYYIHYVFLFVIMHCIF